MNQSTIEAPNLQAFSPPASVLDGVSTRSANAARLNAIARELQERHGANFLRISANKLPIGRWQRLMHGFVNQSDELDMPDVADWYAVSRVGVVSGPGNIRCFDFDHAGIAISNDVKTAFLDALGLPANYQWALPSSSGKGWHVYFKCSGGTSPFGGKGVYKEPARNPNQFKMLELRWHGAQTVLGPSNDPNWHLPDCDMADVSPELVKAAFLSVAHRPAKIDAKRKRTADELDTSLPGGDFNKRGDIRPYLREAGWTHLSTRNDGVELWQRPGSTNPDHNATLGFPASHIFHVLTPNDPTIDEDWHTFFHVYALLKHGGDHVKASADLRAQGYGAQYTTYTDDDFANLLAEAHGDEFRYVKDLERFALYDGTHWVVDPSKSSSDMQGLFRRFVRALDSSTPNQSQDFRDGIKRAKGAVTMRHIVEVVRSNAGIAISRTEFDHDKWLFNLQNGTLDLRTGELRPHDPADLFMRISPVAFDPAATAPKFEKFIREVFNNDAELIGYVQRALGYALTGNLTEHAMWIGYGDGANGKSTLLNTVLHVMGSGKDGYGATTSFSTFADGKSNGISDDLEALNGKRFIFATENAQEQRINEARVKSVTGGDQTRCRALWGQWYEYKPTYKVWLGVNHKPIVRGMDRGIWRRLKLVPFVQNFEAVDNKQLREELECEAPGILNWLLAGLRAYLTDGELKEPQIITDATAEYKRENDTLGQWIDENCETGNPDFSESQNDLFADFKQWLIARGDTVVRASATWFGRQLSERAGIEKGRYTQEPQKGDTFKKGQTLYRGIRLAGQPVLTRKG